MVKSRILTLTILLLLLAIAMPVHAGVESKVLNTIKLSNTPVDLEVSLNGQRIYVLDDKSTLLIYDRNGRLQDKLTVPAEVTQIKLGARDSLLYLVNPKDQTIQVLKLAFTYKIDTTNSPFKGPADAPVTLVVFSDFQCPYCARIGAIIDGVAEQFPGKVKIVFKHFPLPNHKYAAKASQASMAAHEQGKFWEFHDLVFKNYSKLSDQKIDEFVETLKLDKAAFDKAKTSKKIQSKVNGDRAEGKRVGVSGTPSVFVNGQLVRPANQDGIKRAIEAALK